MMIWFLFSILLAISNLQFAEPTSDRQKLCEAINIKKPSFCENLKITNNSLKEDYERCAAVMSNLLVWKDYSVLSKIIEAFGQPKVVKGIENVRDTFNQFSWKDPYCIKRISEVLLAMEKRSIDYLREVLAVRTEGWWKPILSNANIDLHEILQKLVDDETFRRTFEIYLAWMAKNAGVRCSETSLVEISAFGTMKKFDVEHFEKLFSVLCFKRDNKNGWNASRLRSLFESNHIKESDFERVVFVLQECSDVPTGLLDRNINGWNLKDFIDALWSVRRSKTTMQSDARIYTSAIAIKLKKNVFDSTVEKGKGKYGDCFGKYLGLFLSCLEDSSFKVDPNEEQSFSQWLFSVGDIEYKATQMEGNYLKTEGFVKACISYSLSAHFMNSFLEKALNAKLPLDTFEPFICIACRFGGCKDGRPNYDQVQSLMDVFLELDLMTDFFLSRMKSVRYDRARYVNLYDAVSIYNSLGKSVSQTGISAYFLNVIRTYGLTICSKDVIEAIIRDVGSGWSGEEYGDIYNLICSYPIASESEPTEDKILMKLKKLGQDKEDFAHVKMAINEMRHELTIRFSSGK